MPETNHAPLWGTFRPLRPSRRGEAYAWGLAAVMATTAALLAWRVGVVPWFVWIFLGFFLGAAILSSFAYWMDAQTVLTLDEQEGLTFRNGLRRVRLAWPEVSAVRIFDDRWGKRIAVHGQNGQHFTFRTVTEVEIHEGRPQKLFGFEKGEALAQTIIRQAGLTLQTERDDEVYYARG